MREAFTYMFKDNYFYKKAFVYFILAFIPMTILAITDMNSCSNSCQIGQAPVALSSIKFEALCYNLLAIFFYILSAGYFMTSLEAVIRQKTNIILPFFNFDLSLKKGFKFTLGVFIIGLISMLIMFSLTILGMTIFRFALSIIFVFCIILFIIYFVAGYSFTYLFATEYKILTFLNFKQAFKNIMIAPKNYFKYWGVLMFLNLIVITLVYLFERLFGLFNNSYLTMVLTNIISCTLGTYFGYVSLMLISKSVKTDSVV